jgi:hypothetical protein
MNALGTPSAIGSFPLVTAPFKGSVRVVHVFGFNDGTVIAKGADRCCVIARHEPSRVGSIRTMAE